MKIIGIAGNIGAGKDSVAAILQRKYGFETIAYADSLKRLCRKIFGLSNDVLWGSSDLRNQPNPEWQKRVKPGEWRVNFVNAFYDVRSLFEGAPRVITDSEITSAFNEQLAALEEKGDQLTARYVLQRMGTDFGRKLWDEVWLRESKRAIGLRAADRGYSQAEGISIGLSFAPKGIVITDVRFPNEAAFNKQELNGRTVWIDASERKPVPEALQHASEPKREDFIAGDEDLIDFDIDNNGPQEDLEEKVDAAIAELFD